MLYITDFNAKVPANIVKDANEVEAKIISGEMHAFDGPIHKQDGSELIPAGQRLNDGDLWKMDYFVEGVIGSVPQ